MSLTLISISMLFLTAMDRRNDEMGPGSLRSSAESQITFRSAVETRYRRLQ